jgi:predicted TIM-barrel fold metal-dependent hydrolase
VSEALTGGWDAHVHVFDDGAPARPGHYRPLARPLSEVEAAAEGQGVRHLVLVQPSVYGSDNRLLLQALTLQAGRHRAVVVLPDAVDEASLDAMHAAGVRGARLNLVSPVGEDAQAVGRRFQALAPRLRARGWHLQWYVAPEHLPQVAALHARGGPPAVLDHLGGLHTQLPADDPAWAAMAELAAQGAWVKLSGWYRLRATAPYAELLSTVRRLHALFESRMVWGSDWPHTLFADQALPSYASTWQPVVDALGEDSARALRTAVPAIYR